MQSARVYPVVAVALAAIQALTSSLATAAQPSTLELRQKLDPAEAEKRQAEGKSPKTVPIPKEAVRVFLYEGEPAGMGVSEHSLAIDYGRSRVLFDRATGKKTARYTAVEGWPADFPATQSTSSPELRLVGPGVLSPWYAPPDADGKPRMLFPKDDPVPVAVAEARLAGMTWKAIQPTGFLNDIKGWDRPDHSIAWSEILTQLNDRCHLEADAGDGKPPRRFTTADGLASNIVTHLVEYDGALWAACVDIYDTKAAKWGLGGLCRYDANMARWQRVDRIDGRPVRWVTMLQKVGDDLWLGFREGDGVEGDKIVFGMGLYAGTYRPKATALVLARQSAGRWTSWSRTPRTVQPVARYGGDAPPAPPSTEYPVSIVRAGQSVLLLSKADGNGPMGNWDVEMTSHVSLLDPAAGRWLVYDPIKDFDADELGRLLADRGEILISSTRGAHRFQPASETWQYLDPESPLRNSSFDAAAVVGNDLWIGYDKRDFGTWGTQGISRYDEHSGAWNYMTPAELGTASAVRRIVALPKGEVWVLFGHRPWLGAAMPWDFYPRESINRLVGLAKFADGKWTFPVAGPDVDKNVPPFFGQSDDLAAIGNRLVYATARGIYVGPKPWKRAVEGAIECIRPADDGKAIEIIRPTGNADQPTHPLEVGRLGQDDDKVVFKPFVQDPNHPIDAWNLRRGPSLMAYSPGCDWMTFRTADGKRWEFGSFGNAEPRGVLQSPVAVWVFSRGEIVRLDRKIVEEQTKALANGK